jgi:hypothetical protein
MNISSKYLEKNIITVNLDGIVVETHVPLGPSDHPKTAKII